MTRISSLLLATTLAILPLTAFAQPQNPVPAHSAMPSEPSHLGNSAETAAPGVKTQATAEKDVKTTHAKLTSKPAVPAKTAEPGKS